MTNSSIEITIRTVDFGKVTVTIISKIFSISNIQQPCKAFSYLKLLSTFLLSGLKVDEVRSSSSLVR